MLTQKNFSKENKDEKKCIFCNSETQEDQEQVYYFYEIFDGTEIIFSEEMAVAYLLKEEAVFLCDVKEPEEDGDGPKLGFMINCNDVFYWASADCEALAYHEIEQFYLLYKHLGYYGMVQWVCNQRKMRPQIPIEKEMKEKGVWTEELEAFPVRTPQDCG